MILAVSVFSLQGNQASRSDRSVCLFLVLSKSKSALLLHYYYTYLFVSSASYSSFLLSCVCVCFRMDDSWINEQDIDVCLLALSSLSEQEHHDP